MPKVYEYRCKECGKVTERERHNEHITCSCGAVMVRKYSIAGVVVK